MAAGGPLTLVSFALTLVQILSLSHMVRYISDKLHLRWARRWLLATFLTEVNFLACVGISDDSNIRWGVVRTLQLCGPIISGALTLAFMFAVAMLYMTGVGPFMHFCFF